MKLDENYKIEALDDNNVILQRRRVVQDEKSKNYGQEQWDIVGYYGNVKAAFQRYCNIQLNNSLENYATIMRKYDELMAKIDTLEVK
jgi:hypothetical protein